MLEDVVNSLITRFLGEYIKDIGKKDLKVSMWKGDVKLKNLVCFHLAILIIRK